MNVLSFNGRPGTRQGSRTPHRGAVLPVDAYSLAVACGSRGVSLDIWPASHSAPAAPRAVRLSGHDRDRSPSRTTRRATTWFPPRRSARQARSVRASAAPLAVGGTLPPRALPRSWRTGAFAMRRPPMLLRCSEALAQLLDAAFTRRALRPGNVACGDQRVRGTLAPRHHAGTNILLSKALGATGRKAAFAPRHYRIPPPGDMPRKATSAASGRRSGSDGALRTLPLRPPAQRTPPRRASSPRCRGSPRCGASRGSPPAGHSDRSRRPSAAPATRAAGTIYQRAPRRSITPCSGASSLAASRRVASTLKSSACPSR